MPKYTSSLVAYQSKLPVSSVSGDGAVVTLSSPALGWPNGATVVVVDLGGGLPSAIMGTIDSGGGTFVLNLTDVVVAGTYSPSDSPQYACCLVLGEPWTNALGWQWTFPQAAFIAPIGSSPQLSVYNEACPVRSYTVSCTVAVPDMQLTLSPFAEVGIIAGLSVSGDGSPASYYLLTLQIPEGSAGGPEQILLSLYKVDSTGTRTTLWSNTSALAITTFQNFSLSLSVGSESLGIQVFGSVFMRVGAVVSDPAPLRGRYGGIWGANNAYTFGLPSGAQLYPDGAAEILGPWTLTWNGERRPVHVGVDSNGVPHVVVNYVAPTSGTDAANQDAEGRPRPTLSVTNLGGGACLIGQALSIYNGFGSDFGNDFGL